MNHVRLTLASTLIWISAMTASAALQGCGEEQTSSDIGASAAPAGTSPAAAVTQRRSEAPAGAFKFVTGRETYPVPETGRPAKGVPFTDPNFRTTITRITDKTEDGYEDPGISNEYAKADPENSDGSMLILRGNSAIWYLYDARSHQVIRRMPEDMAGGAPEFEPRWDPLDPDLFYYLYGAELRSYNVETSESQTVHDFKSEYPGAEWITTGSEGDASLDRRYWAFTAQDADFNVIAVFVYDREEDRIVGSRDSFPDSVNFVSMDMLGSYVIIGYDEQPYEIAALDFSGSVSLPRGAAGHGDVALTADGRQVMVYQNVATDRISMAYLDTGQETALLEIPFGVNTDLGMHISGNCSETPGWVLISTYGSKMPAPDEERSWMDEQLFMLELSGNPRVWRIADTHSYTSIDYSGEKVYFAESFAAVNTTGSRVYFASNWENPATDYSDVYVADLVENWSAVIQ